jgi:hypothetical protein
MGLESYRYGTAFWVIEILLTPRLPNDMNLISRFSACNVRVRCRSWSHVRDFQIAKGLLSSKFLQVCLLLFNFRAMLPTKLRDWIHPTLVCSLGCRRIRELSWHGWSRRASVLRSRLSTPMDSTFWGSTLRERLYRAITFESPGAVSLIKHNQLQFCWIVWILTW